ncbi:hypothetical protein [Iningainema tapete]|uniref:Uncharacterized protein n=1 Tax=Iningainema tapete BLCC-T55 TaxID=2748662 RepID=A0A8J6XJR3_9CYAN|nr:hypothetical protein [Iningainema tapete]MBD2774132.1 hypothetical protein [Iningainema tapete BLCC-T55]
MKYTFDIVGVSHVWQFLQKPEIIGVEYVGTQKCTLDAMLKSVEPIPQKWGWDMDEVVGTVIEFWMKNSESVQYWKSRLLDAGYDNLLVARVADIQALQAEFESLLGRDR